MEITMEKVTDNTKHTPTNGVDTTNGNDNAANRKAPSKANVAMSPAQRRDRARRRLKGAESRIETHEDRRDYYREIINRREIVKVKRNGERIVLQLTELDVENYRAKKLMEEALLMQAKNDRIEYRTECDSLLGMNTAGLRQTLQNGRATEYARRMGPKTAEKVLVAVKGDASFGNLQLSAEKKRKVFRTILWDIIVKVSPELKEELEDKPKLYTRVLDILQDQLKPVKKEMPQQQTKPEEKEIPEQQKKSETQEGGNK
jgi:hypothetical protein